MSYNNKYKFACIAFTKYFEYIEVLRASYET